MTVLVVWSLLVMGVDLAEILRGDGHESIASSRPPVSAHVDAPVVTPTTEPVVTVPLTTTVPPSLPSPSPRPGGATTGTSNAGVVVPEPAPSSDSSSSAAPPEEPAVECHSELPLEEAPDAPFNFLCTRGGEPLSWPTDQISLRTDGLSGQQQAALQVAIAQWQSAGHFAVTQVTTPQADVVISAGDLTNGEGGHTTMHYTCTTSCVYDHADVVLSTQQAITQGVWVTTILHELGHVAGLNHVARNSQVMYPTLTLLSPVGYADGDRAGLDALAARRTH